MLTTTMVGWSRTVSVLGRVGLAGLRSEDNFVASCIVCFFPFVVVVVVVDDDDGDDDFVLLLFGRYAISAAEGELLAADTAATPGRVYLLRDSGCVYSVGKLVQRAV